MSRVRWLMLTAGGLGMLRPAPGTWGSTPPVALALVLVLAMGPHWSVDVSIALLGLLFSIACVRFGDEAERRFGGKDPSAVVADEVAGQCVTLLFLPWRAADEPNALLRNLGLAAGAFAAFRVFDILKPPPANGLQKLRAGWGILVDDLVAGVYAAVVVQVVARLLL